MTAPVDNQLDETSNDRTKRPRMDAAKIPGDAYRYADRFRQRLLERQPTMALTKRAWDGPPLGSQLRIAWANTFRLMVEVDGRKWAELAEIIKWLFEHPESGFVVHSPEALRKKYDRIAQVRADYDRRAKTGKPGDGRPPTEFKRWG